MTPEMPYYYLTRPPMDLSAEDLAAFDQLYRKSVERGPDTAIDYTLDLPKWQFLCYLSETHGILLHGSGNPNIAEFEARQSNDVDEFGNRQAVYAASDGIWPMYFAIANREGPVTSLINACIRLIDKEGNRSVPFYFFSINEDAHAKGPWRNGTVYLLPSTTFEQQGLATRDEIQIEIEQWASPVNVLPLAKLDITPEDFPFLKETRGHDIKAVMARTTRDPEGFPWLEEPAAS